VLVVANLDPFGPQESIVHLDGGALGIDGGSRFVLHDEITGERFTWYGTANYVRLDPGQEPVHLFRIEEA
jgi:starch synthase (maltosyl-transferring)